MKKQLILSWSLLAVTVILGVVSFIVLPETVVTQLSLNGNDASTMPKLFAVLLPTALGVGGAVFALTVKQDEKNKNKGILISAVGVLVFIVMLIVNLGFAG